MNATIESLKKQLHEVNRDILGMLQAGANTEKAQKVLKDAREYRESLEDDLRIAANKQGKADEPVIVGVMIISLN